MPDDNSISKFKTVEKIIKSKSGISLCVIVDEKVFGFISLAKLNDLIKDNETEITIGIPVKGI